MLLIDSLFINFGGGLNLLKYLTETLYRQGIDAHYIIDSRAEIDLDFLPPEHVFILKPTLLSRYRFYIKNKEKFSKVLCFGNFPPPIKLNSIVYTYFHNINLLDIPSHFSPKAKLLGQMKQAILSKNKRYTNYWIVQTSNTFDTLKKSLTIDGSKIKIIPFYFLPEFEIQIPQKRSGYLFAGDYSTAKGHENLVQAWEKLHQNGFSEVLHLTVSNLPGREVFFERINQSISKGTPLNNHSFIPFSQLIELYSTVKALIYPSFNESLGLGIIEALNYGCDLIVADLPYAHSICSPSVSFNPYDVDSIISAVRQYEDGSFIPSKLLIHNQISELIQLINPNSR